MDEEEYKKTLSIFQSRLPGAIIEVYKDEEYSIVEYELRWGVLRYRIREGIVLNEDEIEFVVLDMEYNSEKIISGGGYPELTRIAHQLSLGLYSGKVLPMPPHAARTGTIRLSFQVLDRGASYENVKVQVFHTHRGRLYLAKPFILEDCVVFVYWNDEENKDIPMPPHAARTGIMKIKIYQ